MKLHLLNPPGRDNCISRYFTYPLIIVVLFAAAVFGADSYLRPGSPNIGGVRNLMLIYSGGKAYPAINVKSLMPYVSYVDRQGKPSDWFFDSFLWLQPWTDEGISLYHPSHGPRPSMNTDWLWALDDISDAKNGILQLNNCVEAVGDTLNDKDRKVNVVLTIPTAHPLSKDFGKLASDGRSLNFENDADREEAIKWYIDEALARWNKMDLPRVRLVGFYWLREGIETWNYEMVKRTSDYLHQRGMKLFWIPYIGAKGVEVWRKNGIDAAMIQPNYAFRTKKKDISRLPRTARLAQRLEAGIEIEIDPLALGDPEYRSRYYSYLDAGVKYGFMHNAIMGYYDAAGVFGKCAVAEDFCLRELYDQTFLFVKGTYSPRNMTKLPEIKAVDMEKKKPSGN